MQVFLFVDVCCVPVLKAHLLSCTVHCRLWLQNTRRSVHSDDDDDDDDEEEGEDGYQSELQAILDSMTRRMIKSELEDFELVQMHTSCIVCWTL